MLKRLALLVSCLLLSTRWAAAFDDAPSPALPGALSSQCPAAAPFSCPDPDPAKLGRVEPSTGEYVLAEEDMRIRGVGFDFVWKRHYQSRRRIVEKEYQQPPFMHHVWAYEQVGIPGWGHSYQVWLQPELELLRDCGTPDGNGGIIYQYRWVTNIRMLTGDGRADLFKPSRLCLPGQLPGEEPTLQVLNARRARGIHAELYSIGGGADPPTYQLHWGDGGVWYFEPPPGSMENPVRWDITAIEDRNGNRMTLIRDDVLGPDGYEYRLLVGVVDTLGRLISIEWDFLPWGGGARLEPVISRLVDFTGREVRYDYYEYLVDADSNGQWDNATDWNSDGRADGSFRLSSVTLPAVTGTPNGNDFPEGKTRRYAYDTEDTYDLTWGQRLTHVVDARGNVVVENEYTPDGEYLETLYPSEELQQSRPDCAIAPGWFAVEALPVNRVAKHVLGGEEIHYQHAWSNEPVVCTPDKFVVVNDRMGNVVVYFYDSRNLLEWKREYTGRADPDEPTLIDPVQYRADGSFASNPPGAPLRAGEPEYHETSHVYSRSVMRERTSKPRGNDDVFTYEGSDNRFFFVPRVRQSIRDGGLVEAGELYGGIVRYDVDTGWWGEYTGLPETTVGGYLPEGTLPSRPFYVPLLETVQGHEGRTYFWYDQKGRLRTVQRGLGRNHPGIALPGEPEICSTTVCESYEYDEGDEDGQGLLTAVIHPDNGSDYRRRDTFEYERLASCTESDCDQSCTHCPRFGYLSKQVLDVGGEDLTTTFEWDDRGNLVSTLDPKGTETVLDVNALDQVVRTTVRFTLPNGTPVEHVTDLIRDETTTSSAWT